MLGESNGDSTGKHENSAKNDCQDSIESLRFIIETCYHDCGLNLQGLRGVVRDVNRQEAPIPVDRAPGKGPTPL